MLLEIESTQRDVRHPVTTFSINETVYVVSLGRTGRITGTEGGRWLVRLTEGDTPIPCDASNLEKRQTLLG